MWIKTNSCCKNNVKHHEHHERVVSYESQKKTKKKRKELITKKLNPIIQTRQWHKTILLHLQENTGNF